MNKTVGIVAHVDAGKTTLIEQMLYITDTIRQAGRVDNQNTVLDYHSVERERGITVFSDQASIKYKNSVIHIIDTPGHVDFCAEMERAVKVLDCAIIVISAAEGIQGHTETVWKLLRQYHVPTIFFINKLDRVGADFYKVIDNISSNLSKDIQPFAKPDSSTNFTDVVPLFHKDSFDTGVAEFIVEHDSDSLLLEKYLNEEHISYSELQSATSRLLSSCDIFPCLCGCGLKNIGIDILLDFIDCFVKTNYDASKDFGAVVYKIKHDESRHKLAFIKVNSGCVKIKDVITHNFEENISREKINQIKVYSGSSPTMVNSLNAGEFGALSGIDMAYVGEGIGISSDISEFALKPVLQSMVVFDDALNPKEVFNIFKILNSEDPSLEVEWIEALGQLHINVMGIIQLEVLKHTVKERFDIDVYFEQPEVLYKETIAKETIGFGHYEPYRHYAEVKLRITPTDRNFGISFSSNINHDILNPRWQKVVSKLIYPACRKGVIIGSVVTDVHIELIKGSADIKHTAGGDFHQAVSRAVRHGLENVTNILLEPYYNFKITIEQDLCGKVMNDITKMSGVFEPPVIIGQNCIITGRVPVASSMNYAAELASFTKGRGNVSFIFDGYDVCHNRDEIVAKFNYDCKSDIEFTSNSIYCNKGNVYTIPGNDAENYRRN